MPLIPQKNKERKKKLKFKLSFYSILKKLFCFRECANIF